MNISLGVVSGLIKFVLNSIDTGVGTSGNVGITVLGHLLVGLLGGGGSGTLNSLGDVVGNVLSGLHFESFEVLI